MTDKNVSSNVYYNQPKSDEIIQYKHFTINERTDCFQNTYPVLMSSVCHPHIFVLIKLQTIKKKRKKPYIPTGLTIQDITSHFLVLNQIIIIALMLLGQRLHRRWHSQIFGKVDHDRPYHFLEEILMTFHL